MSTIRVGDRTKKLDFARGVGKSRERDEQIAVGPLVRNQDRRGAKVLGCSGEIGQVWHRPHGVQPDAPAGLSTQRHVGEPFRPTAAANVVAPAR